MQLCHFALAHGANQDRSSDRRGHILQSVCVSLCEAVKYMQILQSRHKHGCVLVGRLGNVSPSKCFSLCEPLVSVKEAKH